MDEEETGPGEMNPDRRYQLREAVVKALRELLADDPSSTSGYESALNALGEDPDE